MKNIHAILAILVIGAALLTARPAVATILFVAGEDTSNVTLIGGAAWGISCNSGSFCRSTFARGAFFATNNATVADPPANRLQTAAFTASATLWVHAQLGQLSQVTTANQQALLIRSPDGVSRIVVRETGTAGQLKVSTRNAAGTITDLATASGLFSAAIQSFDLFVNYTCSSAGVVQLYLAGVQVINFSGNPCTDSATSLNQVEFAADNSNDSGWSEIIITDTQDTRSMSLYTDPPLAAGNTQSWTPNTLANINKTTISDATNISTTSNNALSEWTAATSLPTGSWTVLGVVQEARVEANTTSPQHFEWVARTGGTDNVTGSVAPLVGSFSNFQNMWTINPSTSVAWTTSDVTAAGFNLGIESLP